MIPAGDRRGESFIITHVPNVQRLAAGDPPYTGLLSARAKDRHSSRLRIRFDLKRVGVGSVF